VWRNLVLLCAASALFAQDGTPKTEIEREQALRRRFERALAAGPPAALETLPLVIERRWIGEVSFRDACALAKTGGDSSLPERLILATGLHNPALALRESSCYLPLPGGRRLFERFVLAAPGEAMAMAAGTSDSARATRELLSGSGPPEFPLLLRLANDSGIDLLRRQRMAVFVGRIARGTLSFELGLKIAGDTQRFFAAVVEMRVSATGADADALDRVLEGEALVLCRAARESLTRTVADLSGFGARELYVLLALGRAEATPDVFSAIFDRLLARKWTAETPSAKSLLSLLGQTHNWGLRDFAAGALDARRLDRFLSLSAAELTARLVQGIEQSADPVKEGMLLAEIAGATTSPALLQTMRTLVSGEVARCGGKVDSGCSAIYGLLAAKLGLIPASEPYQPFFRSSETLDTALLFGEENHCIQRHFFYDDDDGVKSFESFRRTYEGDRAWEVEDAGTYLHLTGRGAGGRRTEIFANVPIDTHLPQNRVLEGEASRRQQAIGDVLEKRGLVATVIVHRGHSFWTDRTLSYITKTARLVILGSCGGMSQVERVIEASHDSQVIATRGIGETAINDAILKAVNDRILNGDRLIQWDPFWRELGGKWGRSGLFRDYVAPHQDSGIVFLRAYYRYIDSR
jgi:hypothetical protein